MDEEPIVYEGAVLPEWIDYNGHMNDACYVNVFSESVDNFMVCFLGMDERFRTLQQVSLYTLQVVVNYLKEIGKNELLQVGARVLEHDSKKLRLFLTMRKPTAELRIATMEVLLLNVDMIAKKGVPFLAETQDKIEAISARQRHQEWPLEAGRGVSLRK